MGAVPKNKITRAERGKRRSGNRPFLVKDGHSSVPLHKRGFVAELLKFVGLTEANKTPEVNTPKIAKVENTSSRMSAPGQAMSDKKTQKNFAKASKTGSKIEGPRTTNK